ncbi:YncE family protein [Maribacter chungangensis]|uniref:YncE family protein n=1 Tax=Maribacter chungangensis TaxID=1069117 RepID=A0ABW3B3E5_9FLAO
MRIRSIFLMTALAGFVLTGCTDDDTPEGFTTLEISATQQTFSEGDGTVPVTFRASQPFSNDVEFTYEVTGTAVAGEDYESLSGRVLLAAGSQEVIQNIILIDNDEVAPSKEMTINITGLSGMVDGSYNFGLPSSAVTLTITDNDSFAYENGILVLNEGNFFAGNASVSFISEDLANTSNAIFAENNDMPLGDVAQSMAFHEDLAYIIVNNSQKIEVVNRYTFESVATIATGLLNPRYMAFSNGKGYVSNWGDGADVLDDFVAVIDLSTYSVERTFSVPEGPEWVLANADYVYVAHQGGFGQNNIVTIINTSTNTVDSPITVANRPNSMQIADGYLWVLSGGNPSWTGDETAGQLDKIDLVSNTVLETLEFAQTEHPGFLSVDKDTLYYLMDGNIFSIDVTDASLPAAAIISGVAFYDMTVNNGMLYGVDAKDFASNGSLEIYDLASNSLSSSLEVSVIPGAVYFNGSFEF